MASKGHEFQITIFSPEGRLYQVEYAFKAIKTSGLTSIGVKGKNCVVVCTEKRVPDKLIEESSVTNIFNITEGIGCLTTGILPDAKAAVSRARQEAYEYFNENGHTIPVDMLAARMADIAQLYTQKAFTRPLGVETIFCSIDLEKGPLLYKVDPAGHFYGYKAVSAGVKEQESVNYLEKQFKKKAELNTEFSEAETIELAISTLQNVLSTDFKANDIEVGFISAKENVFRKLGPEAIEERLNAIANRD